MHIKGYKELNELLINELEDYGINFKIKTNKEFNDEYYNYFNVDVYTAQNEEIVKFRFDKENKLLEICVYEDIFYRIEIYTSSIRQLWINILKWNF